jgi:hypothetical protein
MPRKKGSTLTEITYVGRQMVKFGSITLVLLMVGRVTLNTAVSIWKALNPEPPPPPTVGFGTLPKLRFPQRVDIVKPDSYVLETANGSFPDFGDRAKVFFMPQSSLGLLDDEDAREIAATYGYLFEPEIHSSRMYRWTKSAPLTSTLQVDIQSLAFQVTTDYLARPELLANPDLPDNFVAVSTVKRFLSRVESAEDIATASGEIVFKKSIGGELEDAVSYSDADFISVDLNRVPIDDKFRMFTPEGYKGTVYAVLTGVLSGDESLVHFENNYHDVDYNQMHTYPLRNPKNAWQILKSGEGYIASYDGDGQAVIRTVQLSYYDDFEEQEYLQPIYVFEGDDNFIGYVNALDPTYIQSQPRLSR